MKTLASQLKSQMQEALSTEKLRAASATKMSLDDTRALLGMPSRGEMKLLTAQLKSEAQTTLRDVASRPSVSRIDLQDLKYAEAMGSMRSYYKEMEAAAKVSLVPPNAKADLEDMSKGFKKLTIDGNDAHSAMRGLASGFNLLWLTWGNLAPLFAGAAISFGIRKTFDIGSEVEYQVKYLEMLGDKTSTYSGLIRQELRAIDQTTMFSLTELSKVMVTLGQAGIEGAEALKITKISADLATAGMTNMDVTSKLLMQTLAIFPDSAKDIGQAAAQIYQVTKSSLLNVEDIGDSMKYASGANIAYGQSLSEVLALLGGLSQAGVKGTAAGTAIANTMQDLSGRSETAIKAMEKLRKESGMTLKIFNDKGQFRSAAEVFGEIDKALKTFKPEAALQLMNKLFSERGVKAYFAAVRGGTGDLTKMREELEKAKPENLLKAAQGMMDTTKGAVELLKGALVGSLDKVFEATSDRFKGAVLSLRDVFDSDSFRESVLLIVNGVLSIYDAVKATLPILTAFGAAFLAFKGAAVMSAAIAGLSSLLAPMVGLMGMTAGAVGTLAVRSTSASLSVTQLGTSMLVGSAQARAAALGMDVAGVAAAGAAVKMQAASGATKALAVLMGFLANPIVGVVTTLGILGATWWATSTSSQTASEELSKRILKDGKVNVAALDEEIKKLEERDRLLNKPKGSPIADLADESYKAMQAESARIRTLEAELSKTPKGSGYAKELQLEIQKAVDIRRVHSDSWVTLAQKEDEFLLRRANEKEENERKVAAKAKAASDKLLEDAARAANGKGLPGATPDKRPQLTSLTFGSDNSLKELEKQATTAFNLLEKAEADKRAMLDASRDAEIISEGEYFGKLLNMTRASAQARMDLLNKDGDEYLNTLVNRVGEMRAAFGNWKASNPQATFQEIEEKSKQTDDAIGNLVNTAESFFERLNANKEKAQGSVISLIHAESVKAQKGLNDLKKSSEDFWRAEATTREKAEAAASLDEVLQYANPEHAAYVRASTEAQIRLTDEYVRLTPELRKAEEASLDFAESQLMVGTPTKEAAAHLKLLQDRVKTLREHMDKLKSGNGVPEAAGNLAALQVRRADLDKLTNDLADAVEAGLYDGAEAGKKKLRDLIVAEMKKKIRMEIVVGIKALLSGGGTLGGAGGLGGSSGGGVGGLAGDLGGGFVKDAILGGTSFGGAMSSGFTMATSGGMGVALEGGLSMLGSATGVQSAMAGLGQIAGALGPIALGIAAIATLAKSLDDSGTYHTGGAGGYSAAGGTEAHAAAGSRMGFTDLAYSEATSVASAGISKAIVGILDSTAKTFGKEAGYYAATGFADDTSKDGAWGALMIKLGDKVVTDWGRGVDKWPGREFGDGEEGQKGYAAALATDIKGALNSIGLPVWATKMLDQLGAAPTLDQLGQTVELIVTMETALTQLAAAIPSFSNLTDEAISGLSEYFGGIQGLAAAFGTYYENFYTEAEKSAALTTRLTGEFAKLGKSLPDTREAFRGMVDAALEANDPKLVSGLLGLQEAFTELVPPLEEVETALEEVASTVEDVAAVLDRAVSRLQASYGASQSVAAMMATHLGDTSGSAALLSSLNASYGYLTSAADKAEVLGQIIELEMSLQQGVSTAQAETSQNQLDALNKQLDVSKSMLEAAKSLKQYVDSLKIGALSTLSPEQQMLEAQRQYASTLLKAKSGDSESAGALQGFADTYLQQAQSYFGSNTNYADVFASVTSELTRFADQTIATYTPAISSIEQQIELMQKQTEVAQEQKKLSSDTLDKIKALYALAGEQTTQDMEIAVQAALGRDSIATVLEGLPPALAAAFSQALTETLTPLVGAFAAAVTKDTGLKPIAPETVTSAVKSAATGVTTVAQAKESLASEAILDAASGGYSPAQKVKLYQNLQDSGYASGQIEEMIKKALPTSTSADIKYLEIMAAISDAATEGYSVEQKVKLYQGIKSAGYTSGQIAWMIQTVDPKTTTADIAYLENLAAGVTPYAKGGSYPGGLALVGEEGPELINFDRPGMVYTAGQTANILGGDSESAALLRELLAELRSLRSQQGQENSTQVTRLSGIERKLASIESTGVLEKAR